MPRGVTSATLGCLGKSSVMQRACGFVGQIGGEAFVKMATEAEKNCPVSKVLNAEISLDAELE